MAIHLPHGVFAQFVQPAAFTGCMEYIASGSRRDEAEKALITGERSVEANRTAKPDLLCPRDLDRIRSLSLNAEQSGFSCFQIEAALEHRALSSGFGQYVGRIV